MLNKMLAILLIVSTAFPAMSYATTSQETKKKEVVVKNNNNPTQQKGNARPNSKSETSKQDLDEVTLKQLHCFPYC